MSDCDVMRESMPMLLTESLDPVQRELTHQHIESCEVCGDEWAATKETWDLLDELPQVEVPARVKARFLEAAGLHEEKPANVIPFHRKPAFRWVAQAAAVAVLVGGAWFGGQRTASPIVQSAPVTVERMPVSDIQPISLSESRVIDSSALSPTIEGRPNISNIEFSESAPNGDIAVSFDVTSHWTVKGQPQDKSMVRLVSYVLESQSSSAPGATAIESVRRVYSNPAAADPEIAGALARVLRNNDEHAGVRIQAVDTLKTLPPSMAAQGQQALIDALKNDPNPAVRMKAIEALMQGAKSGARFEPATLDTLRQKASEEKEILYVRLKAAEALGSVKP